MKDQPFTPTTRKYIIVLCSRTMDSKVIPVEQGVLDLAVVLDHVDTDEVRFTALADDIDLWSDATVENPISEFTITDADGESILDEAIGGSAVIAMHKEGSSFGFDSDRAATILNSLSVDFVSV